LKVVVEQSYPGELAEDGAREKLDTAIAAVVEQLPLVKASKAHRGGELDVVEELTVQMRQMYQARVERLNKAIVEAYGRTSSADR